MILDCTFRDGGYHNNWEYDINLFNEYMEVMKDSVDMIEIGFITPKPNNKGLFANVDDFDLSSGKAKTGVMVNTAEVQGQIKRLLPLSVDFVRVATHFKDVDKAESICKELKDWGYFVCINLMQAADKGLDEITKCSEKISKWDVDVIYLADSLGSLDGHRIKFLYNAIKKGWSGKTGFHAHNNKGIAVSNSLIAKEAGFDLIDCTILGMGRGAGNAETELLLTELGMCNEKIYDLALKFYPLKKFYDWGSNLHYYLAAEYNIHPIYVQNMLSEHTPEDSLVALYKLKGATSFNKERYESLWL